MAIERMIDEFERKDVTARLNEVYQTESSDINAVWLRAQSATLEDEEW